MSSKIAKRLLIIVSILVGSGVAIYLFLAIFVASNASLSPRKTTDVAIILGARVNINNNINPCLLSRITSGKELYASQKVKKIIVTGGNDKEDNANEAEDMKKVLVTLRIPQNDILTETKATSTYENLLYSKEIMKKNNLRTATIVTEPFHIARAKLVAKSLHIDSEFKASDNSPCWEKGYLTKYFLKEPIAIISYILTGKINVFPVI